MEMEVVCASCGQHLSVAESVARQETTCPTCGRPVTLPAKPQAQSTPQTSAATIFCAKCGQQNLENSFKCTRCGFVLHASSEAHHVVSDDHTMGGLIPYKNAQALWAYYLGVFALIPCAGLPLGIAALVLGIRGLKYANLHPDARGKGHAWTGIILGGLCAVVYGSLVVVTMVASNMLRGRG